MNQLKWLVSLAIVACATIGVIAQAVIIDAVVTGRQIADANGTNVAAPNKVAVTANGYVFTDISDAANERVYLADVSTTPPRITLLTDENALRDKIDAVNGAMARPAAVSIQSVGVADDGSIILASDQSGAESGMIFRVNPQTRNITLLAGLDGPPTQTSVEGIAFIAVRGKTIYVVLEANFGALNGDSIAIVSVDAPDGGRTPAQEFVGEAELRNILGFTDPLAFRPVGFLPNGNLVISNSAAAAASDDILEINTQTGAVTLLVAATDIEADIGAADIGPNGGAVDTDGTLYLTNAFGVGDTDDGVIIVRNPGGGRGNAAMLATEAQIIASPSIVNPAGDPITGLFIINASAVSPRRGTVVFADGNCDCLIRIRQQ